VLLGANGLSEVGVVHFPFRASEVGVVHFAPFVRLRTDPAGTRHMAGFFAVRMLRQGREGGFNPFGENPGDDDDDDDDDDGDGDDVEEAPELTEEDERKYSTAPKVDKASHWEYDAAVALEDAAAPAGSDVAAPLPSLANFGTAWEALCEQLYEHDDAEVFCVRWAPDDQMLAVGCGDGVIRVFHGEDGKLAYTLDREGEGNIENVRLPNTCLRWRPATESARTKNVLLAANADGTVCHWHVTSRKCMHTIREPDNQVYALDYRPDGTLFATAGKDYKVRVYDEATKSLLHTLEQGWQGAPSAGHSNRIFALKFSPDVPHLLFSGGWDNTVQLWDLRSSSPQSSFYGAHLCGDSLDVHGHEVLTGSWRPTKQLQLWDTSDGIAAKDLKPLDVPFRAAALERDAAQTCHVYAAQFSKAGTPGPVRIVAGGSGSNEMRLFDRSSLSPLAMMKLPKGVYGLDFAHDGRRIAVAGGDCTVRVVTVPSTDGQGALPAPPPPPAGLPAAPPLPAQGPGTAPPPPPPPPTQA
jgi:WD40 repeat protein